MTWTCNRFGNDRGGGESVNRVPVKQRLRDLERLEPDDALQELSPRSDLLRQYMKPEMSEDLVGIDYVL